MLCFLLGRDRKRKNDESDGIDNSIPYKMMLFQPPIGEKLWEMHFSGRSTIFLGGETHRNMTILTMCKISPYRYVCLNYYEKNENYVKFDFRRVTFLVIFSFL